MDPQIATVFNWLLALVLSLSFHEWGHAYFAKLQGDSTAEDEGRLTLNPLPHIDILGTLVLPVVMMLTSGGMLGWAKPVPVNLRNLRSPKWGHVLVAAAGPLVNLALCFIFVLMMRLYLGQVGSPEKGDLAMAFILPMVQLNAILAFFNLIPITPLDGGTVFPAFLPEPLRRIYDDYIAPYGMFLLIALLVSGSLSWVHQLSVAYIDFSFSLASFLVGAS